MHINLAQENCVERNQGLLSQLVSSRVFAYGIVVIVLFKIA